MRGYWSHDLVGWRCVDFASAACVWDVLFMVGSVGFNCYGYNSNNSTYVKQLTYNYTYLQSRYQYHNLQSITHNSYIITTLVLNHVEQTMNPSWTQVELRLNSGWTRFAIHLVLEWVQPEFNLSSTWVQLDYDMSPTWVRSCVTHHIYISLFVIICFLIYHIALHMKWLQIEFNLCMYCPITCVNNVSAGMFD